MENAMTFLLAAQVAGSIRILAIFGLAGAAFILAAVFAAEVWDEEKCPKPSKILWFMAACAVAVVATCLVPSRSTLIYSAALEHGPEYAERFIGILENMK